MKIDTKGTFLYTWKKIKLMFLLNLKYITAKPENILISFNFKFIDMSYMRKSEISELHKEYLSCHRCERTEMAARCKIFVTFL